MIELTLVLEREHVEASWREPIPATSCGAGWRTLLDNVVAIARIDKNHIVVRHIGTDLPDDIINDQSILLC